MGARTRPGGGADGKKNRPPPPSPRPPSILPSFPQARTAGAALASTTPPITHVAISPFLRCLQTAAGVLEGLGEKTAGVTVEVDPGLCEILGPPFLPPGTPWTEVDQAWLWAGGSPESALTAAGLPASTNVVSAAAPSCWPHPLPETLEAGHARYDRAIAAAAARAVILGGGADSEQGTLVLITHGEALRRAVTRISPAACVFAVQHCGVVGCEWSGGEGDDDPWGAWALLPDESVGVGWL